MSITKKLKTFVMPVVVPLVATLTFAGGAEGLTREEHAQWIHNMPELCAEDAGEYEQGMDGWLTEEEHFEVTKFLMSLSAQGEEKPFDRE